MLTFAETRAVEIAPFMTDEVAVVAHFDLTRIDAKALTLLLFGRVTDEEEIADGSTKAAGWVAALRKAGAKDLYLLVSPLDLPDPPVAVVPLVEGADAQAIGRVLCGTGGEKTLHAWPTCATIHNAVFAGSTTSLERARRPISGPRAELAAAFAASGDGPAQIVLIPSATQRRVVSEMAPTFPVELGGGSTAALTAGLTWASLALEDGPKPMFRIIVQSPDGAAAEAILKLAKDAVKWSTKPPQGFDFIRDLSGIKAQIVADRTEVTIGVAKAADLVSLPYRAAMEGTRRSQCVNNMKNIALAFHNYHSMRGSFPAAASRDKDGRPLLSWRVYLLQYLEQETLFKEFHLDEAWDSPHNKSLIARMPAVYACPDEGRKLRKDGKTTYLVPRGKATIFPEGRGIKIGEITDGTSNTILVVDAVDTLAVTWTKPDDWEVDPEPKRDALFGHHAEGTNVVFADGGVRFVKSTMSDATLRVMLTRSAKDILRSEDY